MNAPTEIKELQDQARRLRLDVSELLKRTENIKASPIIQGYSGMRLTLNAGLDVIQLLKRINNISAESVTGHEEKYDHDSYDAAEALSHEHSNLALIDTYTQTESNLSDAVSKKHSHTAVATDHGHSKILASDGSPDPALSADATGNITAVGDVSAPTGHFGGATHYSNFEADGTLVANGNATVWDDIDFPLIIKTTGAGRPTYATYAGSLESLQWAINDIAQAKDGEIPHAHKMNSQMTWHVHFYTAVQDAADRYVKWQIAHTGSNYGVASPAETVISAEQLIPANTPVNTHYILDIGTFTPANEAPGFHIKASLKRIAASGTAPSVNPFCELMQLHFEKDMNGSRTILTK